MRTIGAGEDEYHYVLNIGMAGSAEDWYHLVKNQIRNYSDICHTFMKNMLTRKV